MKFLSLIAVSLVLSGCAKMPCEFNAEYINAKAEHWPQDYVPGKVFDVDLDERRFTLIKNKVYDPATGEGMSTHCVHWSDQTEFVELTTSLEFTDLENPMPALVRPINAREAEKLALGDPFEAQEIRLFPDAASPDELEPEENEVAGLFNATAERAGTFQIGDTMIDVVLRRPRAGSEMRRAFDPAKLAQGHWKALVFGSESNGKFVAESITVTARPNPRKSLEGVDPALPRVLVIGDSISMNYHEAAKAALDGVANYDRIEGNGFSSFYGIQYIDYWLEQYTKPGHGFDVIQFNFGLHDLKQPSPDAPFATTLDEYKQNLRLIIEALQPTGAKLIFATTTPVPGSRTDGAGRQQGAELKFNAAAREVLADYPDIAITDLHKVVTESDVFDDFRNTADVHFYKQDEREIIGNAVADGIRKALEESRR